MKLTQIFENSEHYMDRFNKNYKEPTTDEKVKLCIQSSVKGTHTLREDGMYDVEGDVDLQAWGTFNLPVKFHTVTGTFKCPKHKTVKEMTFAPVKAGRFFCDWSNIYSLEGIPQETDTMDFSDSKFHCPITGIHKKIKHCKNLRIDPCTNLLSLVMIPGLEMLTCRWPITQVPFSLKPQPAPLRLDEFVNNTILKIPHNQRSVFTIQEMFEDAGFGKYGVL